LKALVTGGAGFIGSSLCEALISAGWEARAFDNFTVGSRKNIGPLSHGTGKSRFEIVSGDCTSPAQIRKAARDCDILFHLAANPEVRMELNNPKQCYRQNVYATYCALEALRTSKASTIVFASTSTIYGRAKTFPTPEEYAPLEPISLYGASKLAGEAMVSAYCHSFDRQGIVLRFANILGPRSTHGVVNDFVRRLIRNPRELQILGDGTQTKSYLYVDDAVDAILSAVKASRSPIEVFNVGSIDQISVREIAATVVDTMGLKAVSFNLSGGQSDGSGWLGDVKNMLLDISKLKARGWTPGHDSRESIQLTVRSRIQGQTRAHRPLMREVQEEQRRKRIS